MARLTLSLPLVAILFAVAASQPSLLGFPAFQFPGPSSRNTYMIANYLNRFCGDVSSFLPAVCGNTLAPGCCGLFAVVDLCRPSCEQGTNLGTIYGANNQLIAEVMYDINVCTALRQAGAMQCRALGSAQCERLRCLMNMMCFPGYDFACYYEAREQPATTTTPIPAQENNVDRSAVVQPNCFQLPELADGEMTGLIDHTKSELRQCPHEPNDPTCTAPEKLRYRTIDGSCNNLQHARWGKSFEPQLRLLDPQYSDGIGMPRKFSSRNGEVLPPPRRISTVVSPQQNSAADVSNMVMAWGQFIDHDFTGTPVIKNGTRKIVCCTGDVHPDLMVENGGPCFPITLPEGDPLGRTCMEFVRSLAASTPDGEQLVPRQQVNTLTSFLDGSAVYGNTQDELDKLKGENGKMRVGRNRMLPESKGNACKKEKEGDYCLAAGDHRVNVFVGLGSLHTLFVREHNRIASELASLNPHWNGDKIFEETRRIISAEFQHITYVHWLPWIFDDITLDKYRLRENTFTYDPNVNPTVSNVFSTAAFRFGHSQVKQTVIIGSRKMKLQDTLLRPFITLGDLEGVLEGLISAPTDEVDPFFADGLTHHMFETNSTARDGLDLVAINIHRGRDHALPPYNEWRELCGLPRLTSFDTTELDSKALSTVYSHIDDVDLFVGGVCEKHLPGAHVGPTFACLLGKQFEAMKFGDRFFYETRSEPEGFTDQQLQEIKKISLAKVMCDNTDITELQRDVFLTEDAVRNPRVSCDTLPGIDLEKWRDINVGIVNRVAAGRSEPVAANQVNG